MTDSALSTTATRLFEQPWLASAAFDSAAIIAPAFISSLLVLLFRTQLEASPALPLWAWVALVLLVDVAHVYATLFRTYFSERARQKNGALLLGIPLACWAAGCLLYSLDGLLFWRVLAYLAAFHFIRQQYGFTAIYSRKDPQEFHSYRWLDQLMVYSAMIYPLLFWHTHLPRRFDWFVDGDFMQGLPEFVAALGLAIYVATAVAYLLKEAWLFKSCGYLNVPRNLLIAGTALSWWAGIVLTNSDFAFTITNVLSHGIPYMALIWLYQHRGKEKRAADATEGQTWSRTLAGARNFLLTYLPAFLLFLCLLAYLEEGLWDGFIWREHHQIFAAFWHLPAISDPVFLAFLIPLLALPQSTHYVLDGFIWRVRDQANIWST